MTPVGIDPTTVEGAAPLIAQTLGLSWPEDRVEILDAINDYRALLYNNYDQERLFDNVFHCIKVCEFPERCTECCDTDNTYQGFTLPEDVAGVMAAWEYGYPLKVRSRWREAHIGMDNFQAPRIEVAEKAEQVPTERPLSKVSHLMMMASHDEDEGRKAYVEVIDDTGTRRWLAFTLLSDTWAEVRVNVRAIVGVSLPSGRRGQVTIAQTDGRVLSVYAPHETVPLYRRYSVADQCKSGSILIQGTRRFQPVCFDHDIVEVGDRLALKAAGSFLKFRENTTDTKQINRAEYDRSELSKTMKGLIARHRGRAYQDQSPYRGRRTAGSKPLEGYSNR